MINFDKLHISDELLSQIKNQNPMVATCYFLSQIYNFEFKLDDFWWVNDAGMSEGQVHMYASMNGVGVACKETMGGGNKCYFPPFETAIQNDICVTVSGTNTNGGKTSNSILTWYDSERFEQLYSTPRDRVKRFSDVDNLYMTFYYKDCDIDKFVWFEK